LSQSTLLTGLLLLSSVTALCADSTFHFTPVDEKIFDEANQLDQKLEKQGLVDHDPTAQAYLENIGNRLIDKAPALERVNFQFRIMRDPVENAFALPNGSVYVNSGLIAAVRNEAQLAGVLSHEIVHVTKRHAYLQFRGIRKKNVAVDIIALAGGAAPGIAGIATLAASLTGQLLIVSSVFGYSRDLEREADSDGFSLLIHAGYSGNAMAEALETLDERLEFEPVEPFWKTHPKLQERIALAKEMAKTENVPHPRSTPENYYFEQFSSVIRFDIQLDLDSRRARTAVDRAQRLVAHSPGDATSLTLLADAYRDLGAKTARPELDELKGGAKKENRNRVLKRTAEEEQKELEASAKGQRALAENRSKAESLYREAMNDSPPLGDPHRGIGMLYEDEFKKTEAEAEYREYLKLAAADANDRVRIDRRLEKLTSSPVSNTKPANTEKK
jgi:predicted Zn-dependent protease